MKKQVCCEALASGTGMQCTITLKNAGTIASVGYGDNKHYDRINNYNFMTTDSVIYVSGNVEMIYSYGGYIRYPVLGAGEEISFTIIINQDGPHTYNIDNDDDNSGGECDENDNEFELKV